MIVLGSKKKFKSVANGGTAAMSLETANWYCIGIQSYTRGTRTRSFFMEIRRMTGILLSHN